MAHIVVITLSAATNKTLTGSQKNHGHICWLFVGINEEKAAVLNCHMLTYEAKSGY